MTRATASGSSARSKTSTSFVSSGQGGGLLGAFNGAAAGGFFDGVTPRRGLDKRDFHLGFPAQSPRLAERPLATRRLGLAPSHTQQPQAVQEPAAVEIVVLAQVEIDDFIQGFRREAQAFGFLLEIALERHRRRFGGHLAELRADDEAFVNEPHRRAAAETKHRLRRVVEFRQPRQRAPSHRGRGFGEPRGLDDARGGAFQILGAQEVRDAGHPAQGEFTGLREGPELFVITGRMHPRPVAAGKGQPVMRPRQPCRGNRRLRQTAQHVGVGLGGGHCSERGSVPSAADDGDPLVPGALRFADRLAHPGFAQEVGGFGGLRLAQGGDEVDDGAEDFRALVAALELFFPPEFAVSVPGGLGGSGERVAAETAGVFVGQRGVFFGGGFIFLLLVERHAVALRQVHKPHRHIVGQRPAHRLPLGRKLRERVERRLFGRVGTVDEQRNRRTHFRVRGERDQRVRIRRAFDQNRLRPDGFQRRQHPPRRPRPVVADTEDMEVGNHAAKISG